MWILQWFGKFKVFFGPEEDLLGEFEPAASVSRLKYTQGFFELI